jgi:uncharacterized coiled-coil DUF342 family protein
MSAFDRLLSQIDAFIRKFYKNQIIKGALLFVGFLVATYLLMITLEYFGRFSSVVRALLLFGFIGVNGFILMKYILIPTFRLRSFGERIDRYQASLIIGRFFPAVSDRLINTLQLNDQMNPNSADYELISASVQQRSATLSVLPFTDAIDFGENRRYLKWVLPIVLLLASIGVFSPSFLKQGTERVVNFNAHYEVPAPFKFQFLTKQNSVEEGEDYNFQLQLVGNEIPEKVYIKSNQGRFLLERTAKNEFQGKLTQLQRSTKFHFEANEFSSAEYNVNVISKTAISKMEATVTSPPYLDVEQELIKNAGDLTVFEGAEVYWSILTKNSKGVDFWLDDKKQHFDKAGFSLSKKLKSDTRGKLVLVNEQSGKSDTTYFSIEVIKDLHPSIIVEEQKDTLKDGVRYFSGTVADDHGLSSLMFVYEIIKEDGTKRVERMNAGRVTGTESAFNFAVDFRRERVEINDQINYYFVVSDNDGVNGSKSTKSRQFQYKLPSLEEVNSKRDSEQEDIKAEMNQLVNKANEFKEKLDRLKKETRNAKQSDWNKQDQIQQLQEDHKSLLENLDKLQEKMDNSVNEKNQLSEIDKELLEQQELVNELLEQLMDEEMKELLDELEELMKQQDKNAIDEKLDQLEMTSEDMKKQLDRSLEMLKRLQVNEKIDAVEKELLELAKEQEDLKKETEGKSKLSEEDVKKQEEINKEFENIKEELKDLDSLNNALKAPMDVDMQQVEADEVTEDLQDAKEKMEKNKGDKAGESQKSAAEKMKQMANEMDAMQSQANQQQQSEDMDALRNILEGLVILSLGQEDVMDRMSKIHDSDPSFRQQGRVQRRIIDDSKIIRDSLLALAERQPMIAQFVDKELNQITVNNELIVGDIGERRRKELSVHQQFVMTSYNNLALLLNESLEQMQSQMKSDMPGSGSCSKPGGSGKPSPGGKEPGDKDMKQQLKDQLEQMKKGMNPGGKSPGEKGEGGDKPGEGQGGMGLGTEQMAKIAAQQSAMRRKLEQMRNELNKDGKGTGNKLNPLIDELEKQQEDLINKRSGRNMIDRQQRILTRLLESEKALNERGLDEKRESKEGKDDNYSNQIRFDEYNKEKLKQIELLRSVDPTYKKYYKDRANEYFNRGL